jgi:hypothetical protein
MTSGSSAKSNLYFDISSATALSELAPPTRHTCTHARTHTHTHIFQVPNLIYIFFCIGCLSKGTVQVRGFWWSFVTSLFFMVRTCLPHAQHPSWRTTHCRLSVTAYSIYLQIPSISGGRLLHPQPEDAPCHSGKGPT